MDRTGIACQSQPKCKFLTFVAKRHLIFIWMEPFGQFCVCWKLKRIGFICKLHHSKNNVNTMTCRQPLKCWHLSLTASRKGFPKKPIISQSHSPCYYARAFQQTVGCEKQDIRTVGANWLRHKSESFSFLSVFCFKTVCLTFVQGLLTSLWGFHAVTSSSMCKEKNGMH